MAVNQLRHARAIQKFWAERFPNTLGLQGAFILLMGGYTIKRDWIEEEKPKQVVTLTPKGFEKLLDGILEGDREPQLPLAGEEKGGRDPEQRKKENLRKLKSRLLFNPFDGDEVSERGNANGVSKAIVLCQTLWFVIQCLIRRIHRLPVTLVEVQVSIQILYAASMYAFWWSKPLDVKEPVAITLNKRLWDLLVHSGEGQGEEEGQPDTAESKNGVISVSTHSDHTDISTKVYPDPIQVAPVLKGTPSTDKSSRWEGTSGQGGKEGQPDTAKSANGVTSVSIHSNGTNGTDLSPTSKYNENMLVVIENTELTEYKLIYRTCHSIMINLRPHPNTEIYASCLCVINAALHSISWNAHFPSPTEEILWKFSCVGMVAFTGIACLCWLGGSFIEGGIYGIWNLRFVGLDWEIMKEVVGIFDGPFYALPLRAILLWWKFVTMTWDSAYNAVREIALTAQGNANNKNIPLWVWACFFVFSYTMLLGYIVCMIYFAIGAFISIRSLPKGAYSLPPGSQIIPHL